MESKIDRKIYCFWTGDNPMSEARSSCLDIIKKYSGCEVILITPENLKSYIVKNHPIHPAYEYLSLTHKSDYLRAYFMHHYGSGYSDIKQINFDWNIYFEELENDKNKFFNGYKEAHPDHIATTKDNNYIKFNYHNLCGVCYFIFKPNTIFTSQWLNTVETILTNKYIDILQNPGTYHPRAVYGGVHQDDTNGKFNDSEYPLTWNEILAQVLHSLMYQNIDQYFKNLPRLTQNHTGVYR
jgi:hypothetical protein